MPEYCTYVLGLAIKVLSTYFTYDCEHVFSKRRNILSTERVEKLVYIQYTHGTLRNISSGKRCTSGAAKPGSSLLNYLTNKMYHELLSVSI